MFQYLEKNMAPDSHNNSVRMKMYHDFGIVQAFYNIGWNVRTKGYEVLSLFVREIQKDKNWNSRFFKKLNLIFRSNKKHDSNVMKQRWSSDKATNEEHGDLPRLFSSQFYIFITCTLNYCQNIFGKTSKYKGISKRTLIF